MQQTTLDADKTALIIVDMQKDFCTPEGALYVGDQVKEMIPRIKSLLARARGAGVPIIFTQDWHDPADEEFNTWDAHCIRDTEGAEVIDELPVEDAYQLRKTRYTAFYETELEEHLRQIQVEKLIITGVVTNICVLHTAADAALRGYRLVVPKDCVAALSDYDQEYGLHHMQFLFQAEIVLADDISFQA